MEFVLEQCLKVKEISNGRNRRHQNQTSFNLFKNRFFCLQENIELKEVTKFSYPLDVFELLINKKFEGFFFYSTTYISRNILKLYAIFLSFCIILYVHSYFFSTWNELEYFFLRKCFFSLKNESKLFVVRLHNELKNSFCTIPKAFNFLKTGKID